MEVTGLAGFSGISPRLEVAEVFVASLGVREVGPMVITLNLSVLTNIFCWRRIPLPMLIILCTNSEMTGLSDCSFLLWLTLDIFHVFDLTH